MADSSASTRLIVPALKPLYDSLSGVSYPMIRFFTGLVLMPHGAQKLFGWFGGNGLEATAGFFAQNLGLTPGIFWAGLVGATEFFGGVAKLAASCEQLSEKITSRVSLRRRTHPTPTTPGTLLSWVSYDWSCRESRLHTRSITMNFRAASFVRRTCHGVV